MARVHSPPVIGSRQRRARRPIGPAWRAASDRPVVIGAAVAALAIVVVSSFVAIDGRGVSALVRAAPPYTTASEVPGSLQLVDHDEAFDGQYYYRMAVSPWSDDERVAGVSFDIPALRTQRIGYPVIVFAVSAGDRDLVPLGLVAVNVAALGALGALAAVIARQHGRHAAWGLLIAGYPGFAYALLFDLAEIVAAALLLASLIALRRAQPVVASALLIGATLTRETIVVVPVALVIVAAWRTRARTQQGELVAPGGELAAPALLVAGLPPIAAGALYQLRLRAVWGELPLDASRQKNVRFPFAGFLDQIDRFLPPTNAAALFRCTSLAYVVGLVVAAILALRSSSARRHERMALVVALGVVPLLSGFIWMGATSFMRALTEVSVLAAVVVLGARLRLAGMRADRVIAAAAVVVGGVTVVSELPSMSNDMGIG